jgi:DNA-binding beta-propeller fold protein YncE
MVASALALVIIAAVALAATGDLTQKAGTAGCIVNEPHADIAGCTNTGKALWGAVSVTVSPDGASAYVASNSSDAVAVFDRATDGTLTQKAGTAGCIVDSDSTAITGCTNTGLALNGAYSVTVSPDGTSVYVASYYSDAVAVFERATDGTLTQKAGTAGCIVNDTSTDIAGCTNTGKALNGAISVTVSPDGTSVYVASSSSDAVAVFDRAADGTLTQKAGTAGCIVNEPSPDITGCDNTGLALNGAGSVTVSPDGASVYVASYNSDAVAVFDRATDGTLTQKAGTAGCIVNEPSTDITGCTNTGLALNYAYSVTVSPDGASVYVASYDSDAVAVFDRATDGTLTQKAGTAGCIVNSASTAITGCDNTGKALNQPVSVTVSPDGASVYVASYASDAVVVFDRAADGTLTQKAGTAGCIVNDASTDITGCTNTGKALEDAFSVTVSPDGTSVYVASLNSAAVAVFEREVPSVPDAPLGVVGVSGDGQVALAWSAPASNGGAVITDYVVEYSADGGVSWSTFADGTSTSTTATVTGLLNGTGYVFRVSAVNSAGTGSVSGSSSSVVPAGVPGAPPGVAGLSGNGVVSVSWNTPASNGGAVVTDYVVEYSQDGGATWSVFADGASASTTTVVGGLSNGVGYVFRVSAVNSAGTGPVSVVSAFVVPAAGGCTIFGTAGDDVLVGTSGADHICGFGGDDRIYGQGGRDTLDGGPGKDKLYGGGGKDTLFGRGGADVLKGGPGNDRLYGGGGKDKLQGQAGNDKLYGGGGKDRLYGGGGKDRLAGQGGNDRLFGQGGKDKLFGGNGKDFLVGGAKKDVLNGGKGKDKAKKPGPDVLVSIEIIVP